MSDVSHPTDPAVMKGVIPYLSMAGRTAEACDFCARAFDAKELDRMPFPDGKPGLIHAQVEINRGALMMTEALAARGEARGTGRCSWLFFDNSCPAQDNRAVSPALESGTGSMARCGHRYGISRPGSSLQAGARDVQTIRHPIK